MKNCGGYSLLELLITMVIVVILSSVAFGFYQDNVIASNRTEGRAALQAAAGTLEKCKSLFGSYNHANCNYADFATDNNFYQISGNGSIAASSFTLTATPIAGEPQANEGHTPWEELWWMTT